jgi:hypothetical protein
VRSPRFYGALLDWTIDVSADRASVCAEDGQCISFHRVAGYTPPTWPTQERPQQMHLDMIVDDLEAAEAAVIDLGATKHPHQPGTSYRSSWTPQVTLLPLSALIRTGALGVAFALIGMSTRSQRPTRGRRVCCCVPVGRPALTGSSDPVGAVAGCVQRCSGRFVSGPGSELVVVDRCGPEVTWVSTTAAAW